MTKNEREFLNDVKKLASKWGYEDIEYNHDYGQFNVDVTINYNTYYGDDCDDIWDDFKGLAHDWGANIDNSGNTIELGYSE